MERLFGCAERIRTLNIPVITVVTCSRWAEFNAIETKVILATWFDTARTKLIPVPYYHKGSVLFI